MPGDLLPAKVESVDIIGLAGNNDIGQNPNLVLAKGGIEVAKEAFASINITHENFFIEKDGGYVSKEAFLTMLYNMSRGELQSLKTVFELMAQEVPIKVSNGERVGPQGQTTVRCTYEKEDITNVLFIRTTGRMHHLLSLYEFSILTCQTSLEELYYNALN